MKTAPVKLVTIIAEGVLEARLLEELTHLGMRGYTRSEVSGHGTRGVTTAGYWDLHQVKIETLVSQHVAEQILDHVAGHYFADYAVIVYVSEVNVVRGEKFLA